jgi:hypothetical protein
LLVGPDESVLSYSLTLVVSQAAQAALFASTNCVVGSAKRRVTVQLGQQTGVCPNPKQDRVGLYAESNAQVFVSGWIRCMNEDGVTLRAGPALPSNAPLVNLDSIKIEHSGCAGAYAEVGSLRVTNSTIDANHWGIVQRSPNSSTDATAALVNLAGIGSDTTEVRNVFKCNGKNQPGACCTASSCPNGGDIWNNSGLPLDATYNSWSAAPIGKCLCDATQQNCSCTGAGTGQTTPPDGLGVLRSPLDSTQTAGTVDTANYSLASDTSCPT